MDNECCAKCRYYHRLKNNFKVGEGFEESHCCDVLLHLPKDESEGWVQEVTPQDRCEMYEEKDHIADTDKMIESTPDDCETCIHNKGVLECDMYGCKYEPTTKNDVPDINVGKWQQINKNEVNVIPEYRCSNCGAEFKGFGFDFDYCPRCGSVMEDEE